MKDDLKILKDSEINKRLEDFPGWSHLDNKIEKEFQFKSFSDAVEFINKLTPFCNNLDHHPDIHVYYKKIVFDLTRYSVGGHITPRDFTVAAEIERLFKNYSRNTS